MATVPQKSFYAYLNGESRMLGKHQDQVLWLSYETGRIVEVTSYASLTVLGEAGLADTQQWMARLHGGYAAVACSGRRRCRCPLACPCPPQRGPTLCRRGRQAGHGLRQRWHGLVLCQWHLFVSGKLVASDPM
jgi:hypothetical protein